MSVQERLHQQKDHIRKRLLKYTRKAFRVLPPLDKPRILDIGCGSGTPTMELARLTDGVITGIDIDGDMLDRLRGKIARAGLAERVSAIKCSVTDMDFPDESFDLIWAEGSIFATGFERGLKEWKRILKPGGFLAVHDEKANLKKKLEQIPACGYELLHYFEMDTDVWRKEYFAPLEELILKTREKYKGDDEELEQLQADQAELDEFHEHPERNQSVFFVLKRV